ncbi:MAG TPA: hypothetical protein VE442_10690 [Jatrophihabitans sp.]|jgi:hypothetical protein|nr:hypothetical protein [Jatrophihabitans sp.]
MPRRHILTTLRSARLSTKLLLATLVAAIVAAGAAFATAAAAKADITLQVSPTSQSIARGDTASYTVTVTSINGFTGSVALAVTKGLPGGATATFAPSSVGLTSGSKQTSTLQVATTSSTPLSTSTLTITGTSGKISESITAGLTVNAPLSGSITVNATPASVTIGAGSTAVYTITLTRANLPGPVTFGLIGGLPSGATATYSPNPTTGNSSTLQIATTPTTSDGTYTVYLVASGQDPSGRTQFAYAQAQLVVSTSGSPFTISGNLSGLLAPGVKLPLNLTMTNPNKKALSVTNLGVTIKSVTKAAGVTGSCAAADYSVTQYSGPYPLTIPGNGSASLSGMGVGSASWPQIRMLDTSYNQDGCKGATLTLAYAGSGQGS